MTAARSTSRPRKPPTAGFTLIEVLVAILVFSFGLLGFVGLQARAIQYSMGAEDSNRAAMLANEMAAAILTLGDNSPAAAIAAMQARAANITGGGLPSGALAVTVAANVSTITVTWTPVGGTNGVANTQHRYVTQVIVP